MASKGDLIIDSAITESEGCLTSLDQPSVCIVNSNYNSDEDIDTFEELDLPSTTKNTRDEAPLVAPDSYLAATQFESQYKYQHQTYSRIQKI